MDDRQAIEAIHKLLDGKEWDADTLDEIAEIVEQTGRTVRNFDSQ